ncbi:TorD/DmsD family molecular chaperone [Piscinibacter defluvii]|uniref:TorD/DmsD family molecular chaperone n=1 Tax=Piscinibacter defluvii TaxID=1796922 RepID=UPI000FDE257B|nr:molecular chaperone TorD family protein [Piscinibacter defluvii]
MNVAREPIATIAGALPVTQRAQLYHFFELALAHPGEDGFDYFAQAATADDFLLRFNAVVVTLPEIAAHAAGAATRYFEGLRSLGFEAAEAAYISLFVNNYPHLPCPPYASLFIASDSDKRLTEMLEIKQFYQEHGVDMAETYDDLPDHLCVELEFLQVLSFREGDAALRGDLELLNGLRQTQAQFIDRFALAFIERLADIAVQTVADNPYSHLLDALRCMVLAHRRQLAASDPGSTS